MTIKNERRHHFLLNVFIRFTCLLLVVCGLSSVFLTGCSNDEEETFTSSGKYLISKINMSDYSAQTGLNGGQDNEMEDMIANGREIVNTRDFAQEVIIRIEVKYGVTGLEVSDIRSSITIKPVKGTTCYYLSATTNDPELSYYIADIAGEYFAELFRQMISYAVSIQRIDTPIIPEEPD